MSSFKKALVTVGMVAMGVAAVACTERIYMGEVKSDAGAPSFTDPKNLDAALGEGGGPRLECIGTECPDPWTTCISEDGPTYKCGTDLRRDPDNCGACGNKCLEYKPIHMTSRCLDGACQIECYNPPKALDPTDWRNCNGLIDDGCEVDVLRDVNNCGACGNKCADGDPCIEGKCGCPPGKIACPFGPGLAFCVDPKNDDNNCGGCGNYCEPPPGACDPAPPSAYYGCREGKCGALKCGSPTADCNGDLGSGPDKCGGDGCEVESIATDDNCGGCGIKCTKPGEHCINEGNGPECGVPCAKFGKVLCGPECVDLLNDVGNCGACGAVCKPPGPNQGRACKKGVCEYECAPGFADCNGDPADGCEVNLGIHPANCGACGNSCDLAAGQPCIEGKCLMTECDAGVTR